LSEAEKTTKELADSNLEHKPKIRLLNQMGLSVGNEMHCWRKKRLV
jgi:hypothetical protein